MSLDTCQMSPRRQKLSLVGNYCSKDEHSQLIWFHCLKFVALIFVESLFTFQYSCLNEAISLFKLNSGHSRIVNALFETTLFLNFSTFSYCKWVNNQFLHHHYIFLTLFIPFGQAQNLVLTLLHPFLILIPINECLQWARHWASSRDTKTEKTESAQ